MFIFLDIIDIFCMHVVQYIYNIQYSNRHKNMYSVCEFHTVYSINTYFFQ